jgi:A/G-specific adenine glycosylase
MTEVNFFTNALLTWFQTEGRHDLPWQQNPTPYRVWVSEIMLQQTQVSTVINYYQIFIKKFSSITLLAKANQDEVLGLWSGLGYYARARHLHRCAQIICEQYQGHFPSDIERLIQLPGIGRSTAGAILSFSMKTRAVILDGNVKRVLTRYHAIEGLPSATAINQQLWELADRHTPLEEYAQYNQAIMDLGATICVRSKPLCGRCPVSRHCQARIQSRTQEFPHTQKDRPPRVQKFIRLLMIQDAQGRLLLEKRPAVGIWGGLWSFPECELTEDLHAWSSRYLNTEPVTLESWPAFNHAFTHFELMIHPIVVSIASPTAIVMESPGKVWYHLSGKLPGGVAAPVSKLLKQFKGK